LTVSQYVGVEPKQYPRIHCSPDVLVEALRPVISPETMRALLESRDVDVEISRFVDEEFWNLI